MGNVAGTPVAAGGGRSDDLERPKAVELPGNGPAKYADLAGWWRASAGPEPSADPAEDRPEPEPPIRRTPSLPKPGSTGADREEPSASIRRTPSLRKPGITNEPTTEARGAAESPAGLNGPRSAPNAKASTDLHDAWRLAFVVVADADLATRAVSKAYLDTSEVSLPSRVELLEATLRISLSRAAENPGGDNQSSVTTALWRLSGEQRAALWLATVIALDNPTLGAVLGLDTASAGRVAARATEWLDVALDHESGPLCGREVDLADFTAGCLPPEEARELEAHLPTCPTCRTKLRASEELTDLKSVLAEAVPEPPVDLTVEALQRQERPDPSARDAIFAQPRRRTPAVRPLAACCAALVVVALVGISVIRPAQHGTDPVAPSDPRAILPGASNTSARGGIVGSSANLPADFPTTIAVTTTSVPAVTFPTVAPARKGKKP